MSNQSTSANSQKRRAMSISVSIRALLLALVAMLGLGAVSAAPASASTVQTFTTTVWATGFFPIDGDGTYPLTITGSVVGNGHSLATIRLLSVSVPFGKTAGNSLRTVKATTLDLSLTFTLSLPGTANPLWTVPVTFPRPSVPTAKNSGFTMATASGWSQTLRTTYLAPGAYSIGLGQVPQSVVQNVPNWSTDPNDSDNPTVGNSTTAIPDSEVSFVGTMGPINAAGYYTSLGDFGFRNVFTDNADTRFATAAETTFVTFNAVA